MILIKEDKDLVSRFVQQICRKVGAIAGAIVAEAWAVTLDKDGMWDGTPPSKRLDRVEILQVSLYSKSINRMKSWKIIRDGKTKSLEDYGELFTDRVESRFFGDYFRGTLGANHGIEKEEVMTWPIRRNSVVNHPAH